MDGFEAGVIKTVVEMSLAGAGIDAICMETKKRQTEIRELAAILNLPLEKVEYPLVCPRCGGGPVVGDNDWCAKCQLEDKLDRWEKEEKEEVRLLQEVKKLDGMQRTRRKRRREKVGTNPRKGPNAELLRILKRDGLPDFEELGELEEEEYDPD